jgi:hypothetical protein
MAALMAIRLPAAAQAKAPRFEDYPVAEIFEGTPATPILVTADQRMFRTRIREGVAKESCVTGRNSPGRILQDYIVVTWACGSPCGMMAIVDAVTGKVYNPPISEGFLLPSLPAAVPDQPDSFVPWAAEVAFRRNSNLMIVKANPYPSKGRTNYVHYFLWENNRWKLSRRIPMEPNER